ncbi:MAG: hypothetical protein ABDI20_09915, partial [Candidatus Bipolaricaulaceae bacterium]
PIQNTTGITRGVMNFRNRTKSSHHSFIVASFAPALGKLTGRGVPRQPSRAEGRRFDAIPFVLVVGGVLWAF